MDELSVSMIEDGEVSVGSGSRFVRVCVWGPSINQDFEIDPDRDRRGRWVHFTKWLNISHGNSMKGCKLATT